MTHDEFLAAFPPLTKGYKPNPASLAQLKDVSLLMVVGPSGVGKTTLTRRSVVFYVPADTTRDRRNEEQDGVDYHFRTDYEKVIEEIKAGQFVQVAIGSGGDFYATKTSSFPTSGWATMSIVADVIPIFRALGFKETITAFITPPGYDEWTTRMSTHPTTDEQLAKRLEEARRSFKFALEDKETHIVLNDDLGAAELQLSNLMMGQFDSERESKGRQAVNSILERLNTSGIN